MSLFKSNMKKTIFDEIYVKIAENEAARKFDHSQVLSDQKML